MPRITKYLIFLSLFVTVMIWTQIYSVEATISESFLQPVGSQTTETPSTSTVEKSDTPTGTFTPISTPTVIPSPTPTSQAPITINIDSKGSTSKISILEWVTAVGAIATPILVLILTGVGWVIGNQVQTTSKLRTEKEERIRQLEDKLRTDRINIYSKILEPYIILLTKDEVFDRTRQYRGKTKEEVASDIILSMDYRTTAFNQVLMGSDGVVRAFNALMQYAYSRTQTETPPDAVALTKLLGNFLLEIRRGVGNEHTSLDNLEMLEWLISDIQKYRDYQIGGQK